MDRLKYYVQLALVLMWALLPLFAFSSVKQDRYDYPFIVPVVHPIGQGTGVVIDGNVITNFHNIEPLFNYQFPFENHMFVIDHKKTFVPITKITALDAVADLAIVQTKASFLSSGYSVDSLYKVREENRGEIVTIVGFPDGKFKTIKGIIKKVSENTIEVEKKDKSASKQMDGFSGAAIFVNGKLAGIHSKSTEETAYFISANKVKELLARPALSCSPVQCVEEEVRRLIALFQNGDEEAADRLREYVEKNIKTMEIVPMLPKHKELQDHVSIDGVKFMQLFASYYEKFSSGNSMEQKVFRGNMFFNLALNGLWPKATRLKEQHDLRRIAYSISHCRRYF